MTWRLLRPIWRLDGLTSSQRLVLLALASFTDQRGANAYPSQSTLARMCCCSRSTIKRAIQVLLNRRLVERTGKGWKGTVRYSVSISPMNHVEAHTEPPTRPTLSHNPSNSNPGNYPSEQHRDSIFISNQDQDRQAVPDRRAVHPISEKVRRLIAAEDREQAERKARLAARHQPQR